MGSRLHRKRKFPSNDLLTTSFLTYLLPEGWVLGRCLIESLQTVLFVRVRDKGKVRDTGREGWG